MAEQTQKDFEAIRKDMEALRADVDSLTAGLRDLAGDQVDQTKADLRAAGERLQRGARQVRETVSGQVEERPLTTLFSAFGIGMVLGTLLGRRG